MNDGINKIVTLDDLVIKLDAISTSIADLSDRTDKSISGLSKSIADLAEHTEKSIANLAEHTEKSIANLAEHTEKSIENLAIMTQKGFADLSERMAPKVEVDERFDYVENNLYHGLDERTEKLEDKMLQVSVILGKKLA